MSTTTSVCPCSTPTITGPTRASSIYGDVNQHTTPSDRLVRTNPNPPPHSSPCPGAGSCSASCRAWRRRRWRRRWSLPSSSTTASSATTSGKAGAAGAEEAEAPATRHRTPPPRSGPSGRATSLPPSPASVRGGATPSRVREAAAAARRRDMYKKWGPLPRRSRLLQSADSRLVLPSPRA